MSFCKFMCNVIIEIITKNIYLFFLFRMKTKRYKSSLVVKELDKENESLCQKVFYCKRENYAALIFSSEFIIQFLIQHTAEHNTTASEPTPAPAELSLAGT